jgi:aminoglycoside/choline kinase family phosphotransferase
VPQRIEALKHWLQDELAFRDYTLNPASADASFRRYFRVAHDGASYIVMDAPPDREDSRPYIQVARLFYDVGLNVPEVIDEDLEQGFLLLSDLGSTLYLDVLNAETVDRLYGDALGALATLQACTQAAGLLPDYDRTRLLSEVLAENALLQPRVCVHRDYHSRNLMVTTKNNPGILDFQDAVVGPVTYDLVSLLRDCYISWPRARVEDWALGYQELALQSGILHEGQGDPAQFLRWFDLMGVQRHLKAAGIFARLNHRDGKPGYLADIPRTLEYVIDVAARYGELTRLGEFIMQDVIDRLD